MQIKTHFTDNEFESLILSKIPDFDRFIDLNFGNGEVLFALNHSRPTLANDPNSTLINFYHKVKQPEFINELENYANAWTLLKDFSNYSANEIFITFQDLLKNIITLEDSEFIIRAIVLMNIDDIQFNNLFNRNLLINLDLFTSSIIKSIINEFRVIKGAFVSLSIDNLVINQEFKKSIELAFKQGFFNHFQNILNLQNSDFISILDENKKLALWYFLSQHCKGKFAYNNIKSSKNKFNSEDQSHDSFKNLLNYFKSPTYRQIYTNTTFFSDKFTVFLKNCNPSESDFICADFRNSGYFSENPRDVSLKNEIVETIEFLKKTKSKWLILFSSLKFIEAIECFIQLKYEIIEIKGKTTIITNNF